jgi:hypothetical protein
MPVAVLRPFGPRGTVETLIARSHSMPSCAAAAGRRTAFSYHISGYLGQRDEPSSDEIFVLKKLNDRNSDLDSTMQKIVSAQGDIAKTELDISGRFFSIFAGMLTVIAIAVAISLVAIRLWFEQRIKTANEKIDDDLKKKTDEIDTRITKRLRDDLYNNYRRDVCSAGASLVAKL